MFSNNSISDDPSFLAGTPGINDRFSYREIMLDSHGNDGGDSNRPLFTFTPPIKSVVGFKVVSATIPYSYLVINSTNNTFTLTESATNSTVTIAPGNYTGVAIAAELASKLTLASTAYTYSVAYSSSTNLLTFTNTSSATFSFTFTAGETCPAYWIGFDQNTTISSTSSIIVSPNTCQIGGTQYVLLCSDIGSRVQNSIVLNGSTVSLKPPVIAKLPIDVDRWGVVAYEPGSHGYFLDYQGSLSSISFWCQLGDLNTVLDFKKAGFAVTIGVLTLKDEEQSRISRKRVKAY